MNCRWLRGVLGLAMALGVLGAAGGGGASPAAAPSEEVIGSTAVANLSIEGMT